MLINTLHLSKCPFKYAYFFKINIIKIRIKNVKSIRILSTKHFYSNTLKDD